MNTDPVQAQAARVAVIVTCFNSGNTLPATIASIVSCNIEVELVVVDDGSFDVVTREVLLELERSGIRVIRQNNQGQSIAASAGLAATSAAYVMRFDSDDVLEPDAVGDLADALDQTPEAAAAWGDFETFGLTTFTVRGATALDPWLLTYVNLIPGSGALLRRTALEAIGGWRLRDGFEDWDVWMSFAERGYTGVYVPGTVFRYRRRASSRQLKEQAATAENYDKLLREHKPLVLNRQRHRKSSHAPVLLKALVPLIDAAPLAPRLVKINACELLARLLWSGHPSQTVAMLWQGLALRRRQRAE